MKRLRSEVAELHARVAELKEENEVLVIDCHCAKMQLLHCEALSVRLQVENDRLRTYMKSQTAVERMSQPRGYDDESALSHNMLDRPYPRRRGGNPCTR